MDYIPSHGSHFLGTVWPVCWERNIFKFWEGSVLHWSVVSNCSRWLSSNGEVRYENRGETEVAEFTRLQHRCRNPFPDNKWMMILNDAIGQWIILSPLRTCNKNCFRSEGQVSRGEGDFYIACRYREFHHNSTAPLKGNTSAVQFETESNTWMGPCTAGAGGKAPGEKAPLRGLEGRQHYVDAPCWVCLLLGWGSSVVSLNDLIGRCQEEDTEGRYLA